MVGTHPPQWKCYEYLYWKKARNIYRHYKWDACVTSPVSTYTDPIW